MDGVLIVDKEQDFTSFDVVAKLRGILHQKKIGHGGTLDPQATGVLPVFAGKATKLCDYLSDGSKVYEAELLLGRTTDTEDIWGNVLTESPVSCTEEEARAAVLSFRGEYLQTPPMVSAKKVGGKKLYELARAGIEVEREASLQQIDEIEVLEIALPCIRFRVSCSKGTYIRTLSADIGKKLGCGACMSALRRLQHGDFRIEDARTLSEIEAAAKAGQLEELLIPVEDVLPYPALSVKEEFDRYLLNGNKLPAEAFREIPPKGETRYKVKDSSGRFLGVYRPDSAKDGETVYLPDKMFL